MNHRRFSSHYISINLNLYESRRRILVKKGLKLSAIIFFALTIVSVIALKCYSSVLPETFHVLEEDGSVLDIFPFSVCTQKEASCINMNAGKSNTIYQKNYPAQLKLFNIIPIKTVHVSVTPNIEVTPCGTPFGIKIYTQGVIVIDISDVNTSQGVCSPAKLSGLEKGDIITHINDLEVKSNEEFEQILQKSKGNTLNMTVIRNEQTMSLSLKPIKSFDDEKYRAGIWVRDSSAGIGTLTFIDNSNNIFAGLGHGICDIDTGKVVPIAKGEIVKACISGIRKGHTGFPGELRGYFINSESMGTLYDNSNIGLYGKIKNSLNTSETVSIGMKQHVKKGPAKILTTIDGTEPSYYDINIDSVNYNINSPTKNIKITVTDPVLLEKTGGIVQGMSGSPIIQNGMLIGAVTHVFINNPSKGYAIFAETMMTNSNRLFEREYKKTA